MPSSTPVASHDGNYLLIIYQTSRQSLSQKGSLQRGGFKLTFVSGSVGNGYSLDVGVYVEVPLVFYCIFSGGGAPQNVDYTRSLGRRMLAQREEARRGSREPARRREESGEERTKGSRRELEALSQSMNRGPKLSLAPHRILPRTDLRFKNFYPFLLIILTDNRISPNIPSFQPK